MWMFIGYKHIKVHPCTTNVRFSDKHNRWREVCYHGLLKESYNLIFIKIIIPKYLQNL